MNTWMNEYHPEMLDADKKVREPRGFFSWTVASVPFLTSLLCIYQGIYRIISVLDGEENETHSRRIHKSGHTPSCQVLSDEPLGAVPVEAFCCIPDPWKMHCGWEGGNRECTLFSRRYTYRKQSRKKVFKLSNKEQKKYFWATYLLWRSHFTSEKKQQRGGNWSSSLGATTHVWIRCSTAQTLTIPFLGC